MTTTPRVATYPQTSPILSENPFWALTRLASLAAGVWARTALGSLWAGIAGYCMSGKAIEIVYSLIKDPKDPNIKHIVLDFGLMIAGIEVGLSLARPWLGAAAAFSGMTAHAMYVNMSRDLQQGRAAF